MPTWNNIPIPEPANIKIPSSIPQNFNWSAYQADPSGTFGKFKGAREVHRMNWKGYRTTAANTKKAILSSPSKKTINAAMQQVRSLRKAKKIAENAKKVADAATKVNDALLKKVPGNAPLDKAARIGAIMGILAAIGVVALLKFQEFISGRTFDDLFTTQIDLTKTNTIAVNNGLKLKTLETKLQKYEQELSANARDYYKLNKQQELFGKSIVETEKQANDALYETRQGKKALERDINEAKRIASDAKISGERISSVIESLKLRVTDAYNTAIKSITRAEQLPKTIEGKPGKDGAPGRDGKPGQDGAPGRDGITTTTTLPGIPGIQGKPGETGPPGLPGRDGKDGKDGKDVDANELKQLNSKLDKIPPLFLAIPKPLTFNETVEASATGTCKTTQPGGCTNKLVNDAKDKVNANTSAVGQANLTATGIVIEQNITTQSILGPQLFDGLNKLGLTTFTSNFAATAGRFFNWAVLDRVLNLLVLATTVHNAAMLSNDIGQTLLGAVGNVLSLFGIKNSEGQPFQVSDIIGRTVEGLIKNIIGESNYTSLTEGWAEANRIYQASINIFNSFQGLASSILNANEMLGAMTGKIGNALRRSGAVLEKSYEWFNPQPKYNRVTQGLEALQQGASTIQQVTQVPLDVAAQVTELTTASTEFVKAVKEDDKPANKGIGAPEPDKIKADELAAKTASATGFDLLEIFFDEDE